MIGGLAGGGHRVPPNPPPNLNVPVEEPQAGEEGEGMEQENDGLMDAGNNGNNAAQGWL